MKIAEAIVMIDHDPHTRRTPRRQMPAIKSEYEILCDELGGPADIGVPIKSPRAALAPYCREYSSNGVLPVLLKFKKDTSSARRHWPWAAFAISHYVFEQKERRTYTDEPGPKEVEALLSQIAQAAGKLSSGLHRLEDLSNRLGDPATPLRRAHIGWLHALVSQAAAGFLADDVNESGQHLLTVDSEKRAFLNRLTEVETGAEIAMSRVDRALLGRDRGPTAAPGLSTFVFRCGVIWGSFTGRKPSANKVFRRSAEGEDPDFVAFLQDLAKVGKAPVPSRKQVDSSLRIVGTPN
jgi:hypothetical protein